MTKNRWKRSTLIDNDQQQSVQDKQNQYVSRRAISSYVSKMQTIANKASNWTAQTSIITDNILKNIYIILLIFYY